MNDSTKRVKNPLFNAAVTGGTFEDFSQNAILLPAREKTPPSALNISPDQLLNEIIPDNTSRDIDQSENFLGQQDQLPPVPIQNEDNYSQSSNLQIPQTNTHQGSNFSSVFSSFSSILHIGPSNNTPKEEAVPPPAGIDSLINQENTNLEPVPLFSTQSTALVQPKTPTGQGSVNVFRRTGLKRPTYAPVPGLSNIIHLHIPATTPPPLSAKFAPPPQPTPLLPPQPTPLLPPQPTPLLPPQPTPLVPPKPTPLVPPKPTPLLPPQPNTAVSYFENNSVSPSNSSTLSNSSATDLFSHYNLPNQFKPISPPPPSLNVLSHIPQPLPTIPSQPLSQFIQPAKSSPLYSVAAGSAQPKNFQSPVMDAIPASEALQNDNLNMVSSLPNQYTTNNNNAPDNTGSTNQIYRPVYHHWFFQKETEGKKIWQPFSMIDSLALEQAFTSNDLDPDRVIATDGGRYDVNILRRQRTPIYWQGTSSEVRRCSWFHKGSPDGRLVPYEENVATRLEEEFKTAFELNQWHRKVELANGETVVFHGPDVLVLFPPSQSPDAWGNTPNQARPRVVKRGMDEFDIDEGEPSHVDHILFMVHGIGSVCDLKFRSVEEVVDEFRNIALQLVQSHYRTSCENGIVHRVEVLPISWHSKLHSDETGIDNQLKSITLESIPKLRDFTNDTLLDILFYTSPVYCQNIISTVGNELNRIYDLFKQRNPTFKGGISLGGHSLGSLILFDLLCHQVSIPEQDEETEEVLDEDVFSPNEVRKPPPLKRKMSRRISYMMGSVGTGQPQIYYPHLNFEPKTFFALGSPIGMFVIIRGLDTLGENFSLPTCPAFFNIFHPYDPIAYRIESLIHSELGKLKPVLIPHHKGRKRMHLELKETMARVGADLKQKVVDSMKSTWNSFYQLAMFHKPGQTSLEEEVQKAFQKQIESKPEVEEEPAQEPADIPHGSLNKGRRVDFILQEAPFEFFNEYIFALTSHVCYWESEDTILLMLKEIYSSMGVSTDSQIPQQTMTIERPPPSSTSVRSNKLNLMTQTTGPVGMNPTLPIQANTNLQPPPTSGFVRKT